MAGEKPPTRTRIPATQRRAPGRPGFYTAESLRDVWLYVEFGRRRDCEQGKSKKPMPALRFCSSRNSQMTWIKGGKRAEKSDRLSGHASVVHSANGKALLRRYQEAKAFLKKEGEHYRLRTPDEISPTEESWRRELRRRLDLLKKT